MAYNLLRKLKGHENTILDRCDKSSDQSSQKKILIFFIEFTATFSTQLNFLECHDIFHPQTNTLPRTKGSQLFLCLSSLNPNHEFELRHDILLESVGNQTVHE